MNARCHWAVARPHAPSPGRLRCHRTSRCCSRSHRCLLAIREPARCSRSHRATEHEQSPGFVGAEFAERLDIADVGLVIEEFLLLRVATLDAPRSGCDGQQSLACRVRNINVSQGLTRQRGEQIARAVVWPAKLKNAAFRLARVTVHSMRTIPGESRVTSRTARPGRSAPRIPKCGSARPAPFFAVLLEGAKCTGQRVVVRGQARGLRADEPAVAFDSATLALPTRAAPMAGWMRYSFMRVVREAGAVRRARPAGRPRSSKR